MASTATQTTIPAHAESKPLRWLRLPMVLYALILTSHMPMLALQSRNMWPVEHYRYFPFLLGAFAYLVWRRWQEIPGPTECRPNRSSFLALLASFGLLAASQLLWSPWLGTVAAILSALAVVLSFGRMHTSRVLPVWLLLWLLLPLPFHWDERLILWLQGFSSQGGSQMLDYLGYNHVLAGYVIDIPGHQFLVEEACSGVQWLFAILAMAAILAVWLRRPLVHGVLLIASAAFWTVAANVIRVTLVVVLYVQRGVDIGDGWTQAMFGVGLFVVALLMLLSTDRLLWFLLGPPVPGEEHDWLGEPAASDSTVAESHTDVPAPVTTGMRLVMLNLIALAFLSVGVLQTAMGVNRRFARSERISFAEDDHRDDRVPLSDVLSEATLPERLAALKRVESKVQTRSPNSDRGRYSIAWRYAGPQRDAIVSVDFPFAGWHDLAGCYQSRGWEVESWTVMEGDGVHDAFQAPFAELRMKDATARHGHLLVTQFTAEGDALAPPSTLGRSLSAWCVAARNRVLKRFGDLGPEPTTVQVQMLVTSDLPLSDEHHQQARQAFEQAVRQIAEQLWPKGQTP